MGGKRSGMSNTRTGRTLPRRARIVPAAYQKYVQLALKLPGAEESTSYGTPAVKIGGKLLSRLRTEAEGALALRCDFVDRQILLQVNPGVFFLTDHYRDYPMILVWLEKIDRDALADIVLRGWRMVAPKKLLAEYEANK
jgi:hypothetical protein